MINQVEENLTTYSVDQIREMFPILNTKVYGKTLVYFDNGAASQKPQMVLDAIDKYYREQNANIHRGVHFLSQEATSLYEQSRSKVRAFINAKKEHEIIFTSGTTQGINTIAFSFSQAFLQKDDEVLISELEHHSNIVPWQMACERTGAKLKVLPINEKGEWAMEKWDELFSERTKMVAVSHVSNSLGTINPVRDVIARSHAAGVPVLLDGAQAVHHMPVDVQELDCDFYVFSGHKMFGPTGVGILYGKEEWLNKLPPYMGGGDMIKTVTFTKTEYNDLPHKFEAGTPNIEGGIALGAAIDFIQELGFSSIESLEKDLLTYATQQLSSIDGLRIIGTSENKVGVISFVIDGLHPYDVGTILDQQGIAVRTGHHCTQPIMDHYCIPGTIRASFSVYNTKDEVDLLVAGLGKAIKMLKR